MRIREEWFAQSSEQFHSKSRWKTVDGAGKTFAQQRAVPCDFLWQPRASSSSKARDL
jgi:hypothetical protein